MLLLDEPLSALDGPLRQRLQDDLAGIFRSTDVTVVHVTHDVGEAFALGDRVAVLRAGRLVQAATPEELWRHPGSAWIANFIGRGNVVTAADGTQSSIAPEAITLQAGDEAMVTSVERRGPVLVVTVRRDDGVTLVASIGGLRRVRVGDRVSVAIEPDGVAALGPG